MFNRALPVLSVFRSLIALTLLAATVACDPVVVIPTVTPAAPTTPTVSELPPTSAPIPSETPEAFPTSTPEADPATFPLMRYIGFKVYDPVYVGIAKDFFTPHGLRVELASTVAGGPNAIQIVSSGSAEAGLAFVGSLANAVQAGLPVHGIFDLQSSFSDQPLERYFVKTGSPLEDAESFKTFAQTYGRKPKWAINNVKASFHYTALEWLKANGIPEDAVEWVNLPFDKQPQALASDQVDIIGLIYPYDQQAAATFPDTLQPLFTDISLFGSKQFTTIFVNKVWSDAYPSRTCAFVAGLKDAVEWIEANPAEAAAIEAAAIGLDAANVGPYQFQLEGQVVAADITYWVELLRARGDITAAWLTPETVASNLDCP